MNREVVSDRVWSDIQANLVRRDGCWGWTGKVDKAGYARRGFRLVHRVVYVRMVGPIPTGMCVCHSCDNPPCSNPAHLWIGTQGDNLRDMTAKGRHGRATPSRKVTPALASTIRALSESGLSNRAVGRQVALSHATIARALRDFATTWTGQ